MPATLLFLAMALPGLAHQIPVNPASGLNFDQDVLPLLREHCFKCHSHASGKSKGGVMLDSANALREPGESGLAPIEKNPTTQSLLLKVIHREEGLPAMPPTKPLAPEHTAILTRWVEAGAPWPAVNTPQVSSTKARKPGQITNEDRKWWSVQPLAQASISKPTLTRQNPIDFWVLEKLLANQIKPAEAADPALWLRRVTYDLTGLPPKPDAVTSFLANCSSGKISTQERARVVDQLLASPGFGEKWGRLWLDLVRYADSDGYRADEFRPNAWRYRDWVVKAFNSDLPYDQFIRLQLAADELEPGNLENAPALGYLRLGIYEYNQRDSAGQWDTILDEITDVTADAVLGLGMACARCHDHKFDPILQRDYFALRAYFAALSWPEATPAENASTMSEYNATMARWRAANQDKLNKLEEMEKPARKKARDGAIEKFPPTTQTLLKSETSNLSPRDRQVRDLAWRQVDYEYDHLENHFPAGETREKWRNLKLELDATRPKSPEMMSVAADIGPVAPPSQFMRRGKSEAAEPATPVLLDRLQPPLITSRQSSSGRRAALAQWLTRPDHPLTARVAVNRIWASLMGTGFVSTTSDFGTLGDKPIHPELLDLLAADFMRQGWHLKPLIRQIVLSEAYGRSSSHPQEAACHQADPENRLLWRGPFRRLTAEEIRDSLLVAGSMLDKTIGGPTVDAAKNRRSLYLPAKRNNRDLFLASFDAADGVISTPLRQNTTTVVQTLLLANGALTTRAAAGLANHAGDGTPPIRIERLFLAALGRPATPAEISATSDFAGGTGLQDLAAALLQSNAFLYLD